MPDVRYCRRCKKLFVYVSGPQICDACKKLEEDEYDKVRVFLRDNPGATVEEVSRETDVSVALIYRFLKDGRLEVSEKSPIALKCENCGVRIRSGRFCASCSKKLANEMISAGRSLKDTFREENHRENIRGDVDENGERGLRYIHGVRKDSIERKDW